MSALRPAAYPPIELPTPGRELRSAPLEIAPEREEPVISLRTVEAARLLDVTPNTLREWERRFGFPISRPSPGGSRQFVFDEVVALREALQGGLSIASAIARARAVLAEENATSLYAAFVARNGERSVRQFESAQTFRSLEGAIEDVLVRALDKVVQTHGFGSEEWVFASTFASGWIRRTLQQTWRPTGTGSVVLADATAADARGDSVYVRTLELLLRLSGFEVVTLSVGDAQAVGSAAQMPFPCILLLAGADRGDDYVDQWTCAVRAALRPSRVAVYRREPQRLRLMGPALTALSGGPAEAREQLLALVDQVELESLESGTRPA